MRDLAATALAVLVLAGCAESSATPKKPPARRALEASPFVCADGVCRQRHVRLPDDGEWRCAERDGVVWCAGGEPAAGVVSASAKRGYACGARRGTKTGERVCIDREPDYPDGGAAAFHCRFEQEQGVIRSCTRAPVPHGVADAPRPLPAGAAPNCWVDADCGGRCDRGSCQENG